MDREAAELWSSQQLLGLVEFQARAAADVAGTRIEKIVSSRRQLKMSIYADECEKESKGTPGSMVHLNPVELSRAVMTAREDRRLAVPLKDLHKLPATRYAWKGEEL